MDGKFGFIFMSIIVLGLIFNTSSFSNSVFADNSDIEEQKTIKEKKEIEREQAKEDREKQREQAKEDREQAKEDREKQREQAKEDREEIKEFKKGILVTSSSSSSVGKVTICHIPPGNIENAHTITVGKPALRAHLNHNDIEGSCDDANLSDISDDSNKNSRLSEGSSNKESKALERAQKIIEKLEQQIAKLDQRLQHIIEKYQSGEYFGNISTTDAVTNSYVISFEGIASSIYDESVTTEMSGKLFLENQVTKTDTTKFNIVSGEVIVGNNVYDIVFGKARSSSSGESGNEDSLVIVAQTIDSQENDNTIKMTLGFDSLKGNIGDSDEEFTILDNSKISQQWTLEGSGDLTINP